MIRSVLQGASTEIVLSTNLVKRPNDKTVYGALEKDRSVYVPFRAWTEVELGKDRSVYVSFRAETDRSLR
jgi:hypothetical protein